MKDSKYLLHWLTLDPKEWQGVIGRTYNEQERGKISEILPLLAPPWDYKWQEVEGTPKLDVPKNPLTDTLTRINDIIGVSECECCNEIKTLVRDALVEYKKRKGGAFVVTDEDATYKKRKKKVEVSEKQIALNL